MSDADQRIGKRLGELRGSRSQAQVAAAMAEHGHSWSQSTVWSVESGRRPLRLAEAESVAQVLEVPVDALLAATDFEQALFDLGHAAGVVAACGDRIAASVLDFAEAKVRLRSALEALPEPDADAPAELFKRHAEAVREARRVLEARPGEYIPRGGEDDGVDPEAS